VNKFKIGDRIRIVQKSTKKDQVCTIIDILEDYGGNSYWFKSDQGVLRLEIETPETIFERA